MSASTAPISNDQALKLIDNHLKQVSGRESALNSCGLQKTTRKKTQLRFSHDGLEIKKEV